MPKYIFLDTWTFSDYTTAEYVRRLANFIKSNEYTIIFDGLLMVELYNPGWENRGTEERGARVARFLSNQRCVIVRPEEVWKSEIVNFPRRLSSLPIKLDLDTLPASERENAILGVLRGDKTLLDNDIDIVRWKIEYESMKNQWLADAEKIIEEGVRQGTIIKATRNRYKEISAVKKEEFLLSLDWRHADTIPSDFFYAGSVMRSIRCSSLCFWDHYIDYPLGETPQKRGGDIGDIFQLSLAPYCDIVMADTKMARTIKRALEKLSCPCQVFTRYELEDKLIP
jgi:hypothetical protein